MIVNVNNNVGYLLEDNSIFMLGTGEYIVAPYEVLDHTKYGDNHTEKICNICHRILPTSEFQKNQNAKDNRQVRRPSCNDCRKEIDGIGMKQKDKKEWKKPHLQPFECPICMKITIPGLTSKVVLNHDHKTGKITGWLCDSCNTGLGRFKDSKDVLRNAILYLIENGVK